MVTEWIPIVAIVASFGFTALIIGLALYYDFLKRQAQSKEIMAAIEKGIEVPFPPPATKNYRNRGLIWSAIGIALFIGIWVSSRTLEGAVWGLLPLLVGGAFLLIAFFEKKEKEVEVD